jgi:hypothetical protein
LPLWPGWLPLDPDEPPMPPEELLDPPLPPDFDEPDEPLDP